MILSRWFHTGLVVAPLALSLLLLGGSALHAQLTVDFDEGGNTPYSLSNNSGEGGAGPEIMSGGPTGNFARLTSLTPSNNNSVAMDENQSVTGPAPMGKVLGFDFRISDNQANTDAGGCCGSAADGMGVGYFATPLYGAMGASNPSAAEGASGWETPVFEGAAVVGLRVFEDVDIVTLNAFGGTLAEVDVRPLGLDLNNGVFHRGEFKVEPDPADGTKSLWSVDIIADVHGDAPLKYSIIDQLPTDVNLNGLPLNRVIAGGRTGSAYAAQDVDNISVHFLPEPGSGTLLGIAACGLLAVRRRRR